MISGNNAEGDQTGTVELIDFADKNPQWEIVGAIQQPLATTKAVLLPDGKVLIGQGVNRSSDCQVDGRPCTYTEKEGLHFQMFDPADNSTTRLARTTVSRGLHGTATLLPDATVFFAGENREALVRPDDPNFPLMSTYAGLLPRGDPDLGVPVGQLFTPMYLFNSDGTRASRPVIELAPEEISYGGHFDIEVAGDPDNISSVVMLRSDHNTHSLTTGDRYVKLSFQPKGAARKSEIRIRAPKVPAQAVPGIYLLYVLDSAGVPSIAKRIDLVN
jgi:galactose oxidase